MREELVLLLRQTPFQAFEVNLSSGETLRIEQPEQAMLTNTGLYVAQGEATERIAIRHITHLTLLEPAA